MDLDTFRTELDDWLDGHADELAPGLSTGPVRSRSTWRRSRRFAT